LDRLAVNPPTGRRHSPEGLTRSGSDSAGRVQLGFIWALYLGLTPAEGSGQMPRLERSGRARTPREGVGDEKGDGRQEMARRSGHHGGRPAAHSHRNRFAVTDSIVCRVFMPASFAGAGRSAPGLPSESFVGTRAVSESTGRSRAPRGVAPLGPLRGADRSAAPAECGHPRRPETRGRAAGPKGAGRRSRLTWDNRPVTSWRPPLAWRRPAAHRCTRWAVGRLAGGQRAGG
jgi:hypothetical protein